MISDTKYVELLENCARYNNRMKRERQVRLPFHDVQTRLSQNAGHLWRSRRERRLGDANSGVVYWYPARPWKKRKNAIPLHIPVAAATYPRQAADADVTASNLETESPWFLPEEEVSDQEFDEFSDNDDFEEAIARSKRGGGGSGGGGGRKASAKGPRRANRGGGGPMEIESRPHLCTTCGARYKTKPGLTYHRQTQHCQQASADDDTTAASTTAPPSGSDGGAATGGSRTTRAGTRSSNRSPAVAPPSSGGDGASSTSNDESSVAPPPKSKSTAPAPDAVRLEPTDTKSSFPSNVEPATFCDFCLGTEAENKKTNKPEILVHCNDCGRAGHPTCLQFTANMITSTKKYGWQCIECKSCAYCGTSENDDQLLFCDDCDKGYHMYCLTPPLAQPPEGSWSCDRCIREFGASASNPNEGKPLPPPDDHRRTDKARK